MSLTFANVAITPPTPPIMEICDRWWVKEAPELWKWPGYAMERMHHLPIPPVPKEEPARLNTLIWPTGASRWGTFTSLVSGSAALQILTAIGTTSGTPQPLVISDPTAGTSITTNMFVVGLRPVFIQDVNARLWLLQLVDERYYWWTQELTFSFAAGDSWATLLTNLGAATNTTFGITVPSVPAAYGTPSPIRWGIEGRPIPLLIDAAAANVGLRFIRQLDGTCAYVNSTTAQGNELSQYALNEGALVLGGMSDLSTVIVQAPANLICSFWGDGRVNQNVTLASLALTKYGAYTGVSGTYAWVQGDLRADDSNANHIAYTAQAATDYYQWLLSLVDATFRGVRSLVLTGNEDRIEWEYQPGRPCEIYEKAAIGAIEKKATWERVITRIVRSNWGDSNIYGDRAPPGYTYSVRLTERRSAFASGSGSSSGSASGSGSGVCQPWKARIRVVENGQVVDGPLLGFGDDEYYLYVDCTCGTPNVGDKGVAVPDPLVPYRWLFVPGNCGGSSSGSGSGSSGSGSTGGVPAVYSTHCIGGLLRVTSGLLKIVNGILTWFNLVVRTEGCCDCGGSGSGSGSSSGVGPGWYCITCGVPDPTVEFHDSPPPSFCAGPYDSEAEAYAACTTTFVPTDCCPDDPLPDVLNLNISGYGDVPLVFNGADTWLTGIIDIPGCGTISLGFSCTGNDPLEFALGNQPDAVDCTVGINGLSVVAQCSPFSWEGDGAFGGGGCGCGDTRTFTVTVP